MCSFSTQLFLYPTLGPYLTPTSPLTQHQYPEYQQGDSINTMSVYVPLYKYYVYLVHCHVGCVLSHLLLHISCIYILTRYSLHLIL